MLMKILDASLTVLSSGMRVLYLQDEIMIHERVELTLGGRATLYQTNADLSLRDKSFDVFNEYDSSLTGSAGVVVSFDRLAELCKQFWNSISRPFSE